VRAAGAGILAPVRRLQDVLPVTVAAAALAAITAVLLPLTQSYDLDVFLRAGHALLHGQAVYPSPNSAAVYSGHSFVYPFASAWPFVPLAALPHTVARGVFLGLCAGGVVAAGLGRSDRDQWPAVLVLATAFTITGLQLGALSPLLLAGAVYVWRLRDRPVAGGLLAAAVVTSKLFLVPLLLWLLLSRRYRTFAWAAGGTVFLLALGFVLGPLGPGGYLHLLSRLGANEARQGFGAIGALMNLGVSNGVAEGLAAVVAVAVIVVAYGQWRRGGDERLVFSAALLAALLVSPVVWSHYLALLAAIPIVFEARRRWFVWLALASWAIAPPHGVHLHTALLGVTALGSWLAVAALGAALELATRMRPWTSRS
jgi:alpha-1,2-mannosyltransferase